MKKINSALVALTVLSATASLSWADFASVKKQAVTATVTTLGTKTVTFNIAIKDTNNVTGPDRAQIAWSNIDPNNLGANPWKIADQLIVADTTITDLLGGIQLVTDNTNANANPQFIDPSVDLSSNSDSNPAGLVMVPATGIQSSLTLPLAWSIKDSSKTVGTEIGSSDPNSGPTTGADTKYQWLFVVDKKTPAIDFDQDQTLDTAAFVDGQAYSTIVDAKGIHFGQADTEFGGGAGVKKSFIYFQSNFSGAFPGNTYKTNQLTLEAFTE